MSINNTRLRWVGGAFCQWRRRGRAAAVGVLGILWVWAGSAGAATVYVSPGQSVQEAINEAAAGDEIVLRDGVYYETVAIKKALSLRAEHGGKATLTNKHADKAKWQQTAPGSRIWFAQGIDWPVHAMRVQGLHAFDYRSKENFDNQECGPYWSKEWQEKKVKYTVPPIYFAREAATQVLWLKLNDDRDPNTIAVDFNSRNIRGQTLVQKDLGAHWNQQQIVVISDNPPVYPIIHWYAGTPEAPEAGRRIDFPQICGIIVNIQADDVTLEGLRLEMAPTVGVEVNNSQRVTIRDCYFSGYQFAINTGYECTRLTVTHCEMDGGRMYSFGGHRNVNATMWDHSVYMNPVKFNGTGLTFQHNYVYEGYDLFQPRGRHKDFPKVPDLRSDVSFNVWQNNLDNVAEFDGVEARMNLRFHHNLVLSTHDALAITTTEDGAPLTIDHNIWWPGGAHFMKLVGTGRPNRGVQFVHNTYFTGHHVSANIFNESMFENNIVILPSKIGGRKWSPENVGTFFPTRHNLLQDGQRFLIGFTGLTDDPKLGASPETLFLLQPGSPAIDAGVTRPGYHQEEVTDGKPDLGAIEHGQTIVDWRKQFGRCGPSWITPENQATAAPNRPDWPKELDRRWSGLDGVE